MIRYDLHIHSTASDGAWSPTDVARAAARAGLAGFALTDHDTMAGWDEARHAAEGLGLVCIPGAEISACTMGQEVHLLSYRMDPGNDGLVAFLARQRQHRRDRGLRFLEQLHAHGVVAPDTSLPEVETLTRPHLAELIIKAGTASSFREAFERFLVPGTPTYVEKWLPDGADVLAVVHAAGGVVSLAHPGHGMPHRVVMALVRSGLDGIEGIHPAHDSMLVSYYSELAGRHGLFVTGGTDFHRPPADGRTGPGIGDLGLESVPF